MGLTLKNRTLFARKRWLKDEAAFDVEDPAVINRMCEVLLRRERARLMAQHRVLVSSAELRRTRLRRILERQLAARQTARSAIAKVCEKCGKPIALDRFNYARQRFCSLACQKQNENAVARERYRASRSSDPI